jgi:transposase
MELKASNVETVRLDHLGIVAGICEELKIAERVDSLIDGTDPRRTVTCGKAVVAMILNGLGFVGRALYMTPKFFANAPVQRLLGATITAENLNDDSLGKALDEIGDFGATELYANVAFGIAIENKLLGKTAHLDSTSMSMEGEYSTKDPEAINIAYGFAKQRPDLKQFVIQMAVTGPADLPFWHEALDGNSSDKSSFVETIQTVEAFKKELSSKVDFKWIADSALYNKNSLLQLKDVLWISRVPESITEAKALVSTYFPDEKWIEHSDGYRYVAYGSNYGDVPQRWVLVHSREAYEREAATFQKNLLKKQVACEKELWHLENRRFFCQKDAELEFKKIAKNHELFSISCSYEEELKYAKKGRPGSMSQPTGSEWHAKPLFQHNEKAIKEALNTKGKFILATNDLDSAAASESSIITDYKEQQSVEKGFRFLKDPWFISDKIFLKSQKRIEALSMVMTLCLLVYNYAQYAIRSELKKKNETIPNQLGKPVQNPTMRWIFQIMTGISVVKVLPTVNGEVLEIVSNMTALRNKILALLGPLVCSKYGIS